MNPCAVCGWDVFASRGGELPRHDDPDKVIGGGWRVPCLPLDAVSTWHTGSRIVDTSSTPHGRVSICVSGEISTDCLYIVSETQ